MSAGYAAEEVEFIKTNYGTMGAARIGLKLGRTRNSVLGKAFRLGLAIRGRKDRHSGEQIAERVVKSKTPRLPVFRMKKRTAPSLPAISPSIFSSNEVGGDVVGGVDGRLRITDLSTEQCRFAIEELGGVHFFCGEPADEGCPYCRIHAKRAYDGIKRPAPWVDERKSYRR